MFQVNNVKISCKIPETPLQRVIDICVKEGIDYSLYNNFIVFKTKGFTYTLFKKKIDNGLLIDCQKLPQHANISCISNIQEIKDSLYSLSSLLSIDCSLLSYSIDTITANGDVGQSLNLEEIVLKSSDLSNKIVFNIEKFPGIFASFRGSIKGIIFRSGKFVIVGAKSISEIEEAQSWLISKVVSIHHHN